MIDSFLEWDVAQQTLTGEKKSGDGYLVKPFGDSVLLAVVDGLGHGEDAAAATKIALDILETKTHHNVTSLFEQCHERLRKSRGAVMSLAVIKGREATVTWMGVGNVEALLLRADPEMKPQKESLLIRPGVIGGQLPTLHASVMPITDGDTLVFVTDGVLSGFDGKVNSRDPPTEIATGILTEYSKGTDDALVLVGRYLGQRR